MMLCIIALAVVVLAGLYLYLFYPRQIMPAGEKVSVDTPLPENYHNDCLHPCVRKVSLGRGRKYAMIQSPLYGGDESMENPILYFSDRHDKWTDGVVVRETPETGYNSDPNIFKENGRIYVFWREVGTPACSEAGTNIATFGCYTENGINFSEPLLYIRNTFPDRPDDGFPAGDSGQCPILVKHGDEYLFYCVCEDYSDYTCEGLALWKGHSLTEPDFVLDSILPFDTKVTVGKWLQKRLFGRLYFIPKPVKRMLWHFDLFEYHGSLYMIFGVGKGKDNILISKSDDWRHFRTARVPLVNNHCSENYVGYRQYYYKSTAFVEDDVLYLFYTAQDQEDGRKNALYMTQSPMKDIDRLWRHCCCTVTRI